MSAARGRRSTSCRRGAAAAGRTGPGARRYHRPAPHLPELRGAARPPARAAAVPPRPAAQVRAARRVGGAGWPRGPGPGRRPDPPGGAPRGDPCPGRRPSRRAAATRRPRAGGTETGRQGWGDRVRLAPGRGPGTRSRLRGRGPPRAARRRVSRAWSRALSWSRRVPSRGRLRTGSPLVRTPTWENPGAGCPGRGSHLSPAAVSLRGSNWGPSPFSVKLRGEPRACCPLPPPAPPRSGQGPKPV